MLSRCIFCDHSFIPGPSLIGFPGQYRTAFDPRRRRVWTVCCRCHGWNLWPIAQRSYALPRLDEKLKRHARLLYQTENIALFSSDDGELIRIGGAAMPEQAWWRYGRELRLRRDSFRSPLSRVGAVTYGAVSYLGANIGLARITGDFDWEADAIADILRWRRFGRTAWIGRAPCPRCNSVLLKLFFHKSASLLLLPTAEGRVAVGLPCSRCDPWNAEKVHRLEGVAARELLRRVLAYRNIAGASRAELDGAVEMIERAGSTTALIRRLASEPTSLYDLDRAGSLALEISVNETAERAQLEMELGALEAQWRTAEELAAIIDEELTPEGTWGRD